MSGTIGEYIPIDTKDPLLSELRKLYIDSFYDYYQFIESKLNLPDGKQIISLLEESFQRMQHELLNKQCRTFLMRDNSSKLVGLLTIEQISNNVVYLAQMAIHPSFKRQGYSSLFIQHMRTIFGSSTSYEVSTRRVNEPALKFYARQGGQMTDDERTVAHDYNPKEFVNFRLGGA